MNKPALTDSVTRAELAVTVTHEPLFALADAGPTERQLEDWNEYDAHADSLEADQLGGW